MQEERRSWPASADVWSLRWRWAEERERIRAEILEERYRFAPLRRVTIEGGETIDLWSARDALILKCLALVLGSRLPLSRRCCHLKGHGGAKWAVRSVLARLAESCFVLIQRTVIKATVHRCEGRLNKASDN